MEVKKVRKHIGKHNAEEGEGRGEPHWGSLAPKKKKRPRKRSAPDR